MRILRDDLCSKQGGRYVTLHTSHEERYFLLVCVNFYNVCTHIYRSLVHKDEYRIQRMDTTNRVLQKICEKLEKQECVQPGDIVQDIDGTEYTVTSRVRKPNGLFSFKAKKSE